MTSLPLGHAVHPGAPLCGVGPQVAVGQHRALGLPGGAGGVLDGRQVGRPRGAGSRCFMRPWTPAASATAWCRAPGRSAPCGTSVAAGTGSRRASRLAARHGAGQVDRDDVLDAEVGRETPGPRPRRLSQTIGDRGAVVLELVAELAVGVQRVVFDDDGAQPQHRVEGHDVLRAVRQDQRHPVARRPRPACAGPRLPGRPGRPAPRSWWRRRRTPGPARLPTCGTESSSICDRDSVGSSISAGTPGW